MLLKQGWRAAQASLELLTFLPLPVQCWISSVLLLLQPLQSWIMTMILLPRLLQCWVTNVILLPQLLQSWIPGVMLLSLPLQLDHRCDLPASVSPGLGLTRFFFFFSTKGLAEAGVRLAALALLAVIKLVFSALVSCHCQFTWQYTLSKGKMIFTFAFSWFPTMPYNVSICLCSRTLIITINKPYHLPPKNIRHSVFLTVESLNYKRTF